MCSGRKPALLMLRRTLLAAPVVAALSCSRRARSTRAVIRVAPSPYLVSSPFYTALEAGYFANAGLDIQLTKELPSLQSVPLLAAGRQDAGFIGLTSGLLNAISRGARVRIVAALEVVSPTCGTTGMIYVRRTDFPHGVQDIRQLRHRIISVTSTTGAWMFGLDKLLERAGMSRADVTIRVLSASQRIVALRSGGVDALLVTSVDLTPMLQTWQITTGPRLAEVMPGFQSTFLIYGERLLDGDVRDGAIFLRAWLRGLHDFSAGRTPAFVNQYAQSFGMDPRLVRLGCRDAYQKDGAIHENDIQSFIDWAARRGDIPRPIAARSVIDTRFLEAMRKLS